MSKETQDWKYIVLQGHQRLVSSFINKGELVVRGQVVRVKPLMYERLIRQQYRVPKSDIMLEVWRDAKEAEIEQYLHRLENIDPDDRSTSAALAEAARREALEAGEVESAVASDIEVAEIEEEKVEEAKSRRRSRKKAEA